MFLELGYLAPHTRQTNWSVAVLVSVQYTEYWPDTNFERIEHLTRLVFNTKTVIISLIDEDEQYVYTIWNIKESLIAFVGG